MFKTRAFHKALTERLISYDCSCDLVANKGGFDWASELLSEPLNTEPMSLNFKEPKSELGHLSVKMLVFIVTTPLFRRAYHACSFDQLKLSCFDETVEIKNKHVKFFTLLDNPFDLIGYSLSEKILFLVRMNVFLLLFPLRGKTRVSLLTHFMRQEFGSLMHSGSSSLGLQIFNTECFLLSVVSGLSFNKAYKRCHYQKEIYNVRWLFDHLVKSLWNDSMTSELENDFKMWTSEIIQLVRTKELILHAQRLQNSVRLKFLTVFGYVWRFSQKLTIDGRGVVAFLSSSNILANGVSDIVNRGYLPIGVEYNNTTISNEGITRMEDKLNKRVIRTLLYDDKKSGRISSQPLNGVAISQGYFSDTYEWAKSIVLTPERYLRDFISKIINNFFSRFDQTIITSIGCSADSLKQLVSCISEYVHSCIDYTIVKLSTETNKIFLKTFVLAILTIISSILIGTYVPQVLGLVNVNLSRLVDSITHANTYLDFFTPIVNFLVPYPSTAMNAYFKTFYRSLQRTTRTFNGTFCLTFCIGLLPGLLVRIYRYFFGSESDILFSEIDQFKNHCGLIEQYRTCGKVAFSQQYRDDVSSLKEQGRQLGNRLMRLPAQERYLGNQVDNLFYYRKIVNRIYNMIAMYDQNNSAREEPFSMHVYGEQGVGKTLISQRLLMDLTGATDNDIYNYNFTGKDDFWNGYNQHRCVMIDEFLKGNDEDRLAQARMYLSLISACKFILPMASMDDPGVGTKGTTFNSEVVLTACNQNHTKAPGIDDESVLRRRHVVIWMKYADPSNKVGFSRMTKEQMSTLETIRFTLKKPDDGTATAQNLAKDLTYSEMLQVVKNLFISHTETAKDIREMVYSRHRKDAIQDFRIEYSKERDVILNVKPTDNYLLGVIKNKISGLTNFDMEQYSNRDEVKSIDPSKCDDPFNLLDDPLYVVSDKVRRQARHSLKSSYEWYHKAAMAVSGLIGVMGFVGLTSSGQPGSVSNESQSVTNQKGVTLKRPVISRNYKKGLNHAQSGMFGPLRLRISTGHVYVLPIKKHYVLCHHHGFNDGDGFFKNGTAISFDYAGKRYEYILDENDIYSDPAADVMLLDLSSSKCPMFPDVTKKFVKNSELIMNERVQACLNVPNKTMYVFTSLACNVTYMSPVKVNGSNQRCHTFAWKYQGNTSCGDCGCPLICTSGPLSGKILGLHVAGEGNYSRMVLPNGFGIVLTMESITELTNMMESSEPINVSQGTLFQKEDSITGPNLIEMEEVPNGERVHLTRKTKLRKTVVHEHLSDLDLRQPAVLSKFDERGDGTDPIINSIKKLSLFEQPEIDPIIFQQVVDDMYEVLENVPCPDNGGFRQLTTIEAISGLPGLLASLNSKTSIGHPLIHSNGLTGKRSLFYFDEEGELVLGDETEDIINDFEEKFNSDPFPDDHRFIGYLKDELREPHKVSSNATRVIFCNDARALISFRKKLGLVICALNNSFEHTGFAIGLNPSSLDMGKIQNYLYEVGTKIIAGDFKGFDQSYVEKIRDACYDMIWVLAEKCGVSKEFFKNFILHETQAPAQIDSIKFRVVSNNYSGCFLTTIINCLVNNFYVRYCFSIRYPTLQFSEHVRMVCLGDDHLISVSDELDWTPLKLRSDLAQLNQVYTHFDKKTQLPDSCWTIFETTFLGNEIREGRYGVVGAPQVPSLMRSILWTRDGGRTLHNNITASIEFLSLHSKETFKLYKERILRACELVGIETSTFKKITYGSSHRIVSFRTAASGADFRRTQGFQFNQNQTMSVETSSKDSATQVQRGAPAAHRGLTDIVTSHMGRSMEDGRKESSGFNDANMSERALNLNFGLESRIYRQTYTWAKSQGKETTIFDLTVPNDILQLGSTDNLQNMPFSNFQYSKCDMTLTFQVNAPPTMQGALAIYFLPLLPNPYTNEPDVGFYNIFTYNHVIIDASINTTVDLEIPYTFWKPYIDNGALGISGYNNYGRVQCRVISPLLGDSESDVNISMFSKFKGEFHIPRVGGTTSFRPVAKAQGLFGNGGLLDFSTTNNTTIAGSANGMSLRNDSSLSADPSVTTGDLSGEVDVAAAGGVQNEVDAELDDLSMDNTMVVGGGIPVQGTYSSMAKSSGAQPTNALQLHPGMLNRYGHRARNSDETKIDWIMSRRNYISSFTVRDSSISGFRVETIPFDSFFKTITVDSLTDDLRLAPSIALMNQFVYWHADINVHFYAVRNRFMSSRLLASFAYGGDIANGTENLYYNQVLEFNGENSWASMKIPWNAPTEYLRTMDAAFPLEWQFQRRDGFHRLGTLAVTVMNEMRSTSVAATEMEVLTFISFENVQLHTMRPYPMVFNQGRNDQIILAPPQAVAQGTFQAKDESTSVTVVEPQLGDDTVDQSIPITEEQGTPQQLAPCKLDVGRKYEFCVSDVHEVQRRYVAIRGFGELIGNNYPLDVPGGLVNRVESISVGPVGPLINFYAAWSGHTNYRIFCANEASEPSDVAVMLIPQANRPPGTTLANALDSLVTSLAGTVNLSPVNSGLLDTSRFYSYPAAEMRYHTSGNDTWVNVSVPFFSLLTYCAVRGINDDTPRFDGGENGHLTIVNATKIVAYTAAGDDFRFHHWRPLGNFIIGAYIDLSNIGSNVYTGFEAAGSRIDVPRNVTSDSGQPAKTNVNEKSKNGTDSLAQMYPVNYDSDGAQIKPGSITAGRGWRA